MLILDGTIGSDALEFLTKMREDTPPCTIIMYANWHTQHPVCTGHDEHPEGIIYLRVSPEIAYTRIQKRGLPSESNITLDYIKKVYVEKEQLFIENKNNPKELEHLPVLVLNGNIDFQSDFAQYYNHLFYIRRFIKQIQDKKDLAIGIHKEKNHHRRCC